MDGLDWNWRECAWPVENARHARNRERSSSNCHGTALKRRAPPQRDRDALSADGRFHRSHAFGPARPISSVVAHQPKDTIRRLVCRSRAHLAQKLAHGPTLPRRVHFAELRLALVSAFHDFPPQNALSIPITRKLVGISDAKTVRSQDQTARQVLFGVFRSDIWRDDAARRGKP
ncbi:hypothetical protein [Lentzea fradiae]|uniref:hypothetical protein n=1 Tax=Lentzea fradiae TaxID=200378 RepID=UPI00115F7B42|nr:hypothetical protein [Lentzea fradiae]